jgi:L-histidine Nalpha-methyltransferase
MQIGHRTIQPDITQTVRKGLLTGTKFLPEWTLLDDNGRAFVSEITALPEYYLSSSQNEINMLYNKAIAYNLRDYSAHWNVVAWLDHSSPFDVSLLESIANAGVHMDFYPVTFSQEILEWNRNAFQPVSSSIDVKPASPDFTNAFDALSWQKNPTLFYVGSFAESLEVNDLAVVLKALATKSRRRDRIIVNFDLMKSPSVIEKAYHDYKGINTMYHKNALVRINREMKANFESRQFEYWPIYDAVTGSCRRYLVSLTEQVVKFPDHHFEAWFKPWETINIGLNQKYTIETVGELLAMAGLVIDKILYDQRKYYAMAILKAVGM